MTPDVDVETLRLLVALADQGSIGKVARATGVSQPAISKRLRAFEARWRIQVAQRSAGGSALTTDGEAVVAWARRVLHEADLMRNALAAMGAERAVGLGVAASLTVAEYLLPQWIAELHQRFPGVQPRLKVVNSSSVGALVAAGEVEIGFIESATLPVDLICQRIGKDRLAIVVAPGHEWARRSTCVPTASVEETPFILREEGSGTRNTFTSALRREPRVAMEVSSTAALLGAARAGLAPAVVSRRAAAPDIETGRLVEVAHELDLLRPLTAVRRHGYRLSDQANALLAVAAGALRAPAR